MNPTCALSELDEYRFEAGGWVVLPAILTAEQLAGLNALLDGYCPFKNESKLRQKFSTDPEDLEENIQKIQKHDIARSVV